MLENYCNYCIIIIIRCIAIQSVEGVGTDCLLGKLWENGSLDLDAIWGDE